jgi:hypothetical protein
MIRHIVSWKLVAESEQGKDLAAAELAYALEALPTFIPEIIALSVSRNIAYVGDNHDVVLVADFASLADLETYAQHPDHVAVAPIVRERTSDRVCVDIEV